MQAEYERIRKRTAEDPGTAGDQGEENWAQLFREWLPSNFQVVTHGRIMNADGDTSGQVDVLVLDPSYPKELLTKKLYLSGGVVAAFECKTTLRAEHIKLAFENAQLITSLLPARYGNPYFELNRPLLYGLLAHSHEWKAEASTPVENVSKAIVREHQGLSHPRDMPDCFCISDLGAWTSHKQALVGTYQLEESGKLQWQPVFGRSTFTAYVLHKASGIMHEPTDFTNVGAMLTDLWLRLAHEHTELQKIAAYFVAVGLPGNQEGLIRPWPMAIYSPEVALRLSTSETPVSRERWDRWSARFPS